MVSSGRSTDDDLPLRHEHRGLPGGGTVLLPLLASHRRLAVSALRDLVPAVCRGPEHLGLVRIPPGRQELGLHPASRRLRPDSRCYRSQEHGKRPHLTTPVGPLGSAAGAGPSLVTSILACQAPTRLRHCPFTKAERAHTGGG